MLENFLREAATSFCFTEGAKEISRTCKSFLEKHDFANFYFISLTKQGELVFLTNQVDYAMNYWGEGLPTRTGWTEGVDRTQNYTVLWNRANLDKEIVSFSESSGCYDGFTVANRYQDVIQAVTFFRKYPIDCPAEYYLKQKELHQWVQEFQYTHRSLIRHAKEHPMYLPKEYFASETKTFYPARSVSLSYRGITSALSFRELDCLFFHAKGFSWPSIASMLSLSYRTVETHLTSIKNKFGLTSRDDLAHLAWTNPIIQSYTPKTF